MVKLECRLETPRIPPPSDLSDAGTVMLHYALFPGVADFSIDGHDLSITENRLPLVDFMGALLHIVRKLKEDGGERIFEFTESTERLTFVRVGDDVIVRPTYATGEAKAPFEEFARAVAAESARLRGELLRLHPSLQRNALFLEMMTTGTPEVGT
jgi:hypothetical protein